MATEEKKEEYLEILRKTCLYLRYATSSLKESLTEYRDPVITELAEAQTLLSNKFVERFQLLRDEFRKEEVKDEHE